MRKQLKQPESEPYFGLLHFYSALGLGFLAGEFCTEPEFDLVTGELVEVGWDTTMELGIWASFS